jgi:putative FmdB family regulatory protein
MPLLEFKCNACEKQFEELVASSSAFVPCPNCGSKDVSRVFGTFAAGSSKSGGALGGSVAPKSGFG